MAAEMGGGMTMDMTGSTMQMNMDMDMSKHKMWMWFHTKLDDTVLFGFWTVTTPGEMAYSCAILLAAAVLLEFVKLARHKAERSTTGSTYFSRLFSTSHITQVLLFLVQITLGYLLMLAFMTFSIWIGLAIVIGLARTQKGVPQNSGPPVETNMYSTGH